MTTPGNTFLTYQAVGNREDLSNVIYNIDPFATPFMSGVERVTTQATKHEWQTQALAAANSANALLEGGNAVNDTVIPTTRLNNYHQISGKVAQVAGTQQAVKKAGRTNEMDYQIMLKGRELKRDMETILLANQGASAADSATNRKVGAVLSWIFSNTSKASTGGSDPSSTGAGVSTRTDGTMRAFTEPMLKGVLQSVWVNGGEPDTILVGGFNKQQFSLFTGRASPIEQTASKKIVAAVSVYESDFGTMKVVADRFMRARDVLVLQMDLWAMGTLPGRNMIAFPIANTGDATQKEILSEYTLEARNEKGNGGVFDVTSA
ncbi:MAG: DUF5309 domain-containing protein [Sphingobacteriales bacterium]